MFFINYNLFNIYPENLLMYKVFLVLSILNYYKNERIYNEFVFNTLIHN